jgi:hypothetical protein
MLARAPLPTPAVKVDKVCTISRGCCGGGGVGQKLFFRGNFAVVVELELPLDDDSIELPLVLVAAIMMKMMKKKLMVMVMMLLLGN